ncbi:hypothetical protein VFPFJ_09852 [Purpureocillium lilacinum]|uniref:Uncharacterized protein n=1 Tax=Purpureocillium lilacinum TaxID=33203 RepID=A0A179GN81_PURLI|nr:hypothetical protein VFPFJ_09852 [Purpureocillium lilacinum]OAQ79366.1 hypothetical protein VFPFJ_09852 [Purpureocillium lilacinum]
MDSSAPSAAELPDSEWRGRRCLGTSPRTAARAAPSPESRISLTADRAFTPDSSAFRSEPGREHYLSQTHNFSRERWPVFITRCAESRSRNTSRCVCTSLPSVSHGPADLKVIDLPDPTPKADEYLIQVQAAAANFFDILQVQGKYQNQPRTFFSLPSAPFPFLIFHVHSFIPHILRIRKGTR